MKTYLLIQIAFVALTISSVSWFLKEIFTGISLSSFVAERKRSLKIRILAGLVIWLVIVSGLSISGFVQDFSSFPPRMMVVLVVPLLVILIITFSKSVGEIVKHIPIENLVRIQVFRVFVEVLLWGLFIENLLPVQMTFEGRNFDVLSGILGLIAALTVAQNRALMILYNVIGLGLLLNILVIAVLSMPTPLRFFMNEPANTIVANFPIVFLPAFLVPLAYTLHFFSLKHLLAKRE